MTIIHPFFPLDTRSWFLIRNLAVCELFQFHRFRGKVSTLGCHSDGIVFGVKQYIYFDTFTKMPGDACSQRLRTSNLKIISAKFKGMIDSMYHINI